MHKNISTVYYSRFLTFHEKNPYSNSMYIYKTNSYKTYNPYNVEPNCLFLKSEVRE